MDTTEDFYYCCEPGCKAPNKMMTTFADFSKGVHNGHKLRAISDLRIELTDTLSLNSIDKDCKDELIKYIDQ